MLLDIMSEIIRLKKELDICVLAHCYQGQEILEIADFVGDSYKLSADAAKVKNKRILFCGVHFMAETAKLLSPEKQVFLANAYAGCPMAEQLEPKLLAEMKKKAPGRKVVAYVNTTAELKALSDVCVTSASAVKIVSAMKEDDILFIPDCNLGDFVAKACPDKKFTFIRGGCPVHAAVTAEEALEARALHPRARLLVHPECSPAVVEIADYTGSTTGIMNYARESEDKEFIIGTEISIIEHLQYDCPNKRFYPLSKKLICPNMKLTTINDVYNTMRSIAAGDGEACEIQMSQELMRDARKCIDEMLRLGQ
ncbi:MAG: quinolinate synthase NadA [Ruminococcus sp.]|nr:quinolinate synthase NadA [Ruminococcus sp.]